MWFRRPEDADVPGDAIDVFARVDIALPLGLLNAVDDSYVGRIERPQGRDGSSRPIFDSYRTDAMQNHSPRNRDSAAKLYTAKGRTQSSKKPDGR